MMKLIKWMSSRFSLQIGEGPKVKDQKNYIPKQNEQFKSSNINSIKLYLVFEQAKIFFQKCSH